MKMFENMENLRKMRRNSERLRQNCACVLQSKFDHKKNEKNGKLANNAP